MRFLKYCEWFEILTRNIMRKFLFSNRILYIKKCRNFWFNAVKFVKLKSGIKMFGSFQHLKNWIVWGRDCKQSKKSMKKRKTLTKDFGAVSESFSINSLLRSSFLSVSVFPASLKHTKYIYFF